MQNFVFYGLLGLGLGGLYAGLAMGIVLVYRGSGIINLATGAVMMVCGFWNWWLTQQSPHLSWVLGLILTLLFAAVIGVAMELLVFWPLRKASPLAKLAASLGLLLVAESVISLIFSNLSGGANPRSILPTGTVKIFGNPLPDDRLWLAGISVALAVGFASLYRWTRFGLATRAAQENEDSAMLMGLEPARLSLANTVLASVLAGAFGVLAGAQIQLDPSSLPFDPLIPALAAALFARFTSFGIACFAGLAMGAIYQLANYYSSQSWFPTDIGGAPLRGVPDFLFFLLVALAMFLRGAKLPGRGEVVEKRLPVAPRPERLLRPAVIAAVLGVVALIVFPYDFRQALMNSLIGILICLSLVVIVGYVGQMSVVQLALAGAAGFAMAHLAQNVGGVWARFPIAALAGVATALVLGMLTAVSALRVRGVALAVVTVAAARAIEIFGFGNQRWGYNANAGSPVSPLHIGSLDLSSSASFRGVDGKLPSPMFGFVALAVTILMCLLVANLRRSDLGQRMLAVRSNERAAAAAGINVRGAKLAAFAVGSLAAGLAGVLLAYNFGSVSPQRFGVAGALALIAFTYFGGITLVSGAVIAGIGATEGLLPHAFESWFGLSGNWALLVGGVALIATLILNPEGIAGTGYLKKQQKKKRQAAAEPGAQRGVAGLFSKRRGAAADTVHER
jgi:branched-chain amino acid transport system permease protein